MRNTNHAPNPIVFPLLLICTITITLAATVSWTGGIEDTFFCGFKWDEGNCLNRQHCPTGFNEECEFHAEGQKCFANSPCDARYGDGSGWVSGKDYKPPAGNPGVPLTPRPTYTGISEDKTDHYWCGKGLDEAKTCVQHCPSGKASDCPQGMICFPDITACDARNIVPDTYRPTREITPAPTLTMPPMGGPTPIPTDMPIGPPDPLPFPSDDPTDHWFCGVGVDDANENCKIPCPTATECPIGHICYFGTQCDGRTFAPTPPPTNRPTKEPTNHPTNHPTNSMPPSEAPTMTLRPSASPSLPIPTRSPTKAPTGRPTWAPLPALQLTFFCGSDWNDAVTSCKKRCPSGEDTECQNGDFCFTGTPCTEETGYPETDDATNDDGGGQACVPFQVTIKADAWPNEVSWVVDNTETKEVVAEGGNEELVPGELYNYPVECINYRKGCYAFTIIDSGGDGLCCGEGQGSYTISYDGKELKTGGVFYDEETTDFGLCGATETPTKEPTIKIKEPSPSIVEGSSTSGYRCVAHSLADRGYQISSDKCNLFDNCFNPQIKVGDDWFCDETSRCIEADACSSIAVAAETSNTEAAVLSSPPIAPVITTTPATDTTQALESQPLVTRPPKGEVGSSSPTLIPTTSSPTSGPCGGEPCSQRDHCRSQYGFCGPNPTYCNEMAIWTKDCPDKSVSVSPTVSTGSPSTAIASDGTSKPTQKVFIKPGGGKGSITKPARTHPPTEPHPYYIYPVVNQPKPTQQPSSVANAYLLESEQPSPYYSDNDIENLSLIDQPTGESFATLTPSNGSQHFQNSSTEPTLSSSAATTTIPPTQAATTKARNKFTCTGERCPIDSQCRSQYGTCGPGFIYCNVYSTWESTCPPPVPGVTPTRSPTTKHISESAGLVEGPSLMAQPTFPPLARPTLTTINGAIPFRVENMSVPGDWLDRLEHDDTVDDKTDYDSASSEDKISKPPIDQFNTAQYLDLWADITATSKGLSLHVTWPFLCIMAATSLYVIIENQ